MSLKMIATIRIYLKDLNIVSTRALKAINYFGREEGLRFGANNTFKRISSLLW